MKITEILRLAEKTILALLLLAMAVIPVFEFLGRKYFGAGIPGAADYLQHLTLIVAFVGAMAATRADKHIRIGSIIEWMPERLRRGAKQFGMMVSTAVAFCLTWAGVRFVIAESPPAPETWAERMPEWLSSLMWEAGLFEAGSLTEVGGLIPVWIVQLVIPIGFLVITLRFILSSADGWKGRLATALVIPVVILVAFHGFNHMLLFTWLAAILLLGGVLVGTPIFILLGGLALVLFWKDGVSAAAVPVETYRIVSSPIFPTIPIFTLVGFILSESRASERLEKVFLAWFGCVPGGAAVAATILCAFFTTFTGASGVTILALGALLLPVLRGNGFSEKFSIGLLTSTGTLGLLLPPSLVVILYGVIAHVPIPEMFIAGILPGTLMVLVFSGVCVVQGRKLGVKCERFDLRKALSALKGAAWEVAMPALVLLLIFSGFCTLVEAAALTAIYALIVETLIYRDMDLAGVWRMLVTCGTLVGGVLIILGVAMGLTSYLVDAQVPMVAAEWVQEHVHARWVFLLALNVALVLVGCLMDIYAAIFVVVPLILPMAQIFGIHPAHLGVIFLANLQLGYLTPPIGMNLFLASFRFNKPLMRVARDAFPFLLLTAVMVLIITYVPWLSLVLLK